MSDAEHARDTIEAPLSCLGLHPGTCEVIHLVAGATGYTLAGYGKRSQAWVDYTNRKDYGVMPDQATAICVACLGSWHTALTT